MRNMTSSCSFCWNLVCFDFQKTIIKERTFRNKFVIAPFSNYRRIIRFRVFLAQFREHDPIKLVNSSRFF